jgi:DMSO/TMAO reductase YedYZ molybdopterin-dependent catalytic subunit
MVMDRRAQEIAMQQAGRLPPGQSLTQKFPVLHYGAVPQMNMDTWRLRIWGEVSRECNLTWEEFNQIPKVQIIMDLHCVTKWSKFDTLWEGVFVNDLLKTLDIQLKPQARFMIQHAPQNFSSNLPIEPALAENFLLATGFDGKELSPEHGYPLRGVVGAIPGKRTLKDVYLWKGAKWLTGLEFLSQDKPGFWEEAGYHNEGDIWLEQRIS